MIGSPKNAAESASYVGGIVSVASAVTLTDIGVLVGIVTALLTFCLNLFYQRKKDRRAEERHRVELEVMRKGTLSCLPVNGDDCNE